MDMLEKASCRLSLHMPGGQGKGPFGSIDPYLLDTTETAYSDDLYAPQSGIAEAQRLAPQLTPVSRAQCRPVFWQATTSLTLRSP